MMRLRAHCVVALLALALLHAGACGPGARREPQKGGEWVRGPEGASEIDGDLDRAAERWRYEISEQRWREDARVLALADDSATAASDERPAVSDGDEQDRLPAVGHSDEQDKPPAPTTFWGQIKAGADAVGKAGFAAVAVAVTVAALVAPYLLFL